MFLKECAQMISSSGLFLSLKKEKEKKELVFTGRISEHFAVSVVNKKK